MSVEDFLKRAALLVAIAAVAELTNYLYLKLELVGIDYELQELTS